MTYGGPLEAGKIVKCCRQPHLIWVRAREGDPYLIENALLREWADKTKCVLCPPATVLQSARVKGVPRKD